MKTRTCLLLLAFAAASASAQTSVYRSTMPDGRIVYGDHPEKGAARVELRDLPPPQVVGSSPALSSIGGASAPSSRELERLDARQRERVAALDRADAEVRSAAAALERAQQRLTDQLEPLPGERVAIAPSDLAAGTTAAGPQNGSTTSGRSRLNEFFLARQITLQADIAAAQARLDRAYAQRNALRD